MIESLQGGSKQAVKLMDASKQQTDKGVEQTIDAGNALLVIVNLVAEINSKNIKISSIAQEQTIVAGEINQNIVSISEISKQSAEGSALTNRASDDMKTMASELNTIATEFKT